MIPAEVLASNRLDPDTVDHLVVTRLELESGINDLERLTGIRPAAGGRHHDWGSHNALLSLGASTYLEVISPDPQSRIPLESRPAVFTRPGSGMVNGWVAKCDDIDRAIAVSHELGHPLGPALHGRRERADGTMLHWTLTDPLIRRFDGLLPILIDWGGSPHPASTAPTGCRLTGLDLCHPEAETLSKVLGRLGLPMTVEHGASPAILATIETPRGMITIS
jgi:hypothetical protein